MYEMNQPFAVVYFYALLILGHYFLMNLFIAILLTNLERDNMNQFDAAHMTEEQQELLDYEHIAFEQVTSPSRSQFL